MPLCCRYCWPLAGQPGQSCSSGDAPHLRRQPFCCWEPRHTSPLPKHTRAQKPETCHSGTHLPSPFNSSFLPGDPETQQQQPCSEMGRCVPTTCCWKHRPIYTQHTCLLTTATLDRCVIKFCGASVRSRPSSSLSLDRSLSVQM